MAQLVFPENFKLKRARESAYQVNKAKKKGAIVRALLLVLLIFPCCSAHATITQEYQDFLRVCGKSDRCSRQVHKCCKQSKKFAIKGDKIAQYEYAYCIQLGLVHGSNRGEAFNWYINSAQQGYGPAYCSLAQYYDQKNESNINAAVSLLRKAVELGDQDAKIELAGINIFSQENKLQGTLSADVDTVASAAENGHARAMMMLGKLYLRGDYFGFSCKKAHNLLELAASKNEVIATVTLGMMAEIGKCREDKNLNLAEEYYKRACEYMDYKDLYPVHKLGRFLVLHYDGEDLQKVKLGMKMLIYAGENNDIEAQKTLIRYFNKGIGVQKNLELRDYWKQRLAQNQQQSGEMHAKVVQEIGLK